MILLKLPIGRAPARRFETRTRPSRPILPIRNEGVPENPRVSASARSVRTASGPSLSRHESNCARLKPRSAAKVRQGAVASVFAFANSRSCISQNFP